jgi:hypothetical protein
VSAPVLTARLLFHGKKANGSLYVWVVAIDGVESNVVKVTDRHGPTTAMRLAAYEGVATFESYLADEPVAELELPAERSDVHAWIIEHGVVN